MSGPDFGVIEYRCHDDAFAQHLGMSSLGVHSKEKKWTVQANNSIAELNVLVDKSIGQYAQVAVECDGQQVFPRTDNATSSSSRAPTRPKAKMLEDIVWSRNFQEPMKNKDVRNFFEVRPWVHGSGNWFAGRITKQREDGLFEAMVTMPDGRGGWNEESFSTIVASDIREAKSKKILITNDCCLKLQVPLVDPLMTNLSVNGEVITHNQFMRITPIPPQGGKRVDPVVNLKVDKKRQQVYADVGHGKLAAFLASEIFMVSQESSRLRHSWTIQIGPHLNGEHTISIEKRWQFSKIVTLNVDGSVLVEAAPEDINCPTDMWQCKFNFKGVRKLNFEVFEQTKEGYTLDSKNTVTKKENFGAACHLQILDGKNLGSAELTFNGVRFEDLRRSPPVVPEVNLVVTPEAFFETYRVQVPTKVDETALGPVPCLQALQGAFSPLMGERNIPEEDLRPCPPDGFFRWLFSRLGCKAITAPCCSTDTRAGPNSEIEK